MVLNPGTSPDPITLDTTTQSNPISLDTGTASYILNPETVQSRSFKAAYGLDGTPAAQPKDTIQDAIASGAENQVRQTAAATLNDAATQNKQTMIRNAIAQKQGPLTQEDLTWINGANSFNTYFDPSTVFETAYANQYTSELDKFAQKQGDQNAWTIARQAIPDDVEASRQYGSILVAKSQYLISKLQNTQSQIENQGLGSNVWQTIKNMIPEYSEIQTRGLVPGTDFTEGGLLDANYEAQSNKLYGLPFPQFVQAVDQIDKALDFNPNLKAQFFTQMLGQSSSDKLLNKINTLGMIGDVGLATSAGKGLYKIGSSVYSAVALKNAVNTAVKSIVANSTGLENTKAAILANVGDLPASAVEQAATKTENLIQGSSNPTQEALDQLGRFFRVDRVNIANDSALAETQRNALIEQSTMSEARILNTLATVMRPQRIPLQEATREVFDAIQKDTFSRYPGMSNAIIRMSDPVLEPISNTYNITGWIGKKAGEFFNDVREAASYGKMHGLQISLNPDQLSELDAKIADLKATIKAGPAMDEDTAGLNYFYKMEDQLKDLQQYRNDFSKPGGYAIGQHGLGHYIEVTAPLNEESSVIKDFIVRPDRATSVSPNSWTANFPLWNKLRTAEDTMSPEQRAVRKASIYPQSLLMGIAHEEGKYLNDLAKGIVKGFDPVTGIEYSKRIPIVSRFVHKDEWKELRDTLDYSQRAPNPDLEGRPGYYFKTPSEMSQYFVQNYGHAPTWAQTESYFAVKRWAEYDRILREVAVYRNKARLGAETHEIISKTPDGTEIRSSKFDGIRRQAFPGGKGNILIMGDDINDAVVKDLSRSASLRDKYDEDIQKGLWRVIELHNPEERPFNGFVKNGDTNIQYVMAKRTETSPLTWQQVSQTGGGHFVYDYEHYIKQAIIRSERVDGTLKHRYEGDQTLHAVPFRAMGEDFVKKLNAVRILLRDGKAAEAKALFERSNLPYEWNEFVSKFKSVTTKDGKVIPASFNLNEDFRVVPKNTAIIDLDKQLERRYHPANANKWIKKGTFIDGTREGNLARNFQIEFTGRRVADEMFALDNAGTIDNPVYNLLPAQKVDPLKIMNRSLGSIVRSTFFDDYKISAVQSWLREAAPYLKADDSEIKSSPFFWFKTAVDKNAFKPGFLKTDPDKINNLLANRFKIDQLIGVPSLETNLMHGIAQKLADTMYEHGFNKSARLIPEWLLSKTRDPFAFIRSITFNAYLGMFSIPQLWVQMATYANIFGLSPRYATSGTFAAMLHGLSRLNKNPEILEHLDGLASGMHIPGIPVWRPGEWKEAMQAADRTGFLNVHNEMYGPLNTLNQAKIIKSSGSKFLSWGQAPFRGGEKATRVGAWYTAFKEFRDVHPTGAIGQGELSQILDRADLLYGNMSSASNSLLHTGILSLPAQFYAYNIRLAEMFFSKRIGNTPMERMLARARLVGMNAAMFGIPMAAGISGLPIADWLRQEYLRDAKEDAWYNPAKWLRNATGTDQAYETGNRLISTLLMEGIPSVMMHWISGQYLDIGQRYGLQGFSQLLKADQSIWTVIGGASGDLGVQMFSNLGGFEEAMKSMISGDHQYKLTLQDVIDAAKSINSVSRTSRLWTALTTGKWVSSNSAQIQDISPANAILMYATGTDPQKQIDARNVQADLSSYQNMQKTAFKQFQQQLNYMFLAVDKNDQDNADTYFKKAVAILTHAGLRPDQVASAIAKSRTLAENPSLVNRVYWNKFISNAPAGLEDKYRNIFNNMQKNVQEGR